MLLWGALVAAGDCNRAGRPGPVSEPSVLSEPAPAACAIANPQLAASNAAANVNVVAFNIAVSPLDTPKPRLEWQRQTTSAGSAAACSARRSGYTLAE